MLVYVCLKRPSAPFNLVTLGGCDVGHGCVMIIHLQDFPRKLRRPKYTKCFSGGSSLNSIGDP